MSSSQAETWTWLHLPDDSKLKTKIRWRGILNALGVMAFIFATTVIFLCRSLYRDFREAMQLPVSAADQHVEMKAGWKLVHADVFRAPGQRGAFCALAGAGVQLLVMGIFVVLLGCVSHYHGQGAVLASMFYCYLVASVCGGYFTFFTSVETLHQQLRSWSALPDHCSSGRNCNRAGF